MPIFLRYITLVAAITVFTATITAAPINPDTTQVTIECSAPINGANIRHTSATTVDPTRVDKEIANMQTHFDSDENNDVHFGRATYYTDGGFGSCETILETDSEMYVALNAEQMQGTTQCGRRIQISNGGKSAEAVILDTCPSEYCPKGALDLSKILFEQFKDLDNGVFAAKWEYID